MESTVAEREKLADALTRCSRPFLESWLLEISDADPEICGVLRWRAEAALGHFDPQALRDLVRHLTEIPADVSWRASGPVERRMDWLPLLVQSALECPSANALPEAIELALWRTEALVMAMQDSEYWSQGIQRHLLALHLQACQRTQPDSRALAQRMARLRRDSGIGWFDDWPAGYEEILGPDGMAVWTACLRPDPCNPRNLDSPPRR